MSSSEPLRPCLVRSRLLALSLLLFVSAACQKGPAVGTPSQSPTLAPSANTVASPTATVALKPIPVEFSDATQAAGITFRHDNGAAGKKYFPERFGSGCAFLDFDNDGWLDILLVSSRSFAGASKKGRSTIALYRNNQNGTFADVTVTAGLTQPIFGIGVAVADYDNDGWTDIFVTGLGQSRLYRNTAGGRFIDVTVGMELGAPTPFPSGAIWFDYDKDGKLDLFVNNYVDWTLDKDVFCSADGSTRSYCTAESYAATTPRLYRNLGPFFVDVTPQAGLDDTPRRSSGAVVVDYDRDGWPDLLVTNDGGPNALYHNNGKGRFTETAVPAGIAADDGKPRRARAVDTADFDRSGLPSFVIAYAGDVIGLYHNKGKAGGLFANESEETGIGGGRSDSIGALFLDYDLDGWQDLLVVNGGEAVGSTGAQPLRLFHNEGKKKFSEVSRIAGKALQRAIAGRGAAYGDYDRDGDLDLLITTNGGPAYLLRNENGNQNRFVRFRTIGTTSNRSGIGTRIAIFLPDGSRLGNWVRAGTGYCSQSAIEVTFGLGGVDRIPRVEIEWPSGKFETLQNLAADQIYTLKEGSGISH